MPDSSGHMPGKLITLFIILSIKQNLSYSWFFGPFALGKLILLNINLSIKQNPRHARILGPHTLGKLISFGYFS